MARIQSTILRSTLKTLLPDALILNYAKELRVVQRLRKVDVVALVWTLVLSFQVGAERSIEGLRHGYQKSTGEGIVRSSFYKRLSAPLAKLLRKLALEAMETLGHASAAPKGCLRRRSRCGRDGVLDGTGS